MPTIEISHVQSALFTLVKRVGEGKMTTKQFFDGMEAWERCFRVAPDSEYTEEKLVRLAQGPHAF